MENFEENKKTEKKNSIIISTKSKREIYFRTKKRKKDNLNLYKNNLSNILSKEKSSKRNNSEIQLKNQFFKKFKKIEIKKKFSLTKFYQKINICKVDEEVIRLKQKKQIDFKNENFKNKTIFKEKINFYLKKCEYLINKNKKYLIQKNTKKFFLIQIVIYDIHGNKELFQFFLKIKILLFFIVKVFIKNKILKSLLKCDKDDVFIKRIEEIVSNFIKKKLVLNYSKNCKKINKLYKFLKNEKKILKKRKKYILEKNEEIKIVEKILQKYFELNLILNEIKKKNDITIINRLKKIFYKSPILITDQKKQSVRLLNQIKEKHKHSIFNKNIKKKKIKEQFRKAARNFIAISNFKNMMNIKKEPKKNLNNHFKFPILKKDFNNEKSEIENINIDKGNSTPFVFKKFSKMDFLNQIEFCNKIVKRNKFDDINFKNFIESIHNYKSKKHNFKSYIIGKKNRRNNYAKIKINKVDNFAFDNFDDKIDFLNHFLKVNSR